MHPVSSIALSVLVLVLTLRYLAPFLLHLALLPPLLRISHLTLSSIRGVSFTSRKGIRLEIDCIRFAWARGEQTAEGRGAWRVVLRLEGVSLLVPAAALSSNPARPPSPESSSTPHATRPRDARPERPHPPPRRGPRRRPHPVVALLTRLAPHFLRRVALRITPVRVTLQPSSSPDEGADRPHSLADSPVTLEAELCAGVSSSATSAGARDQQKNQRPHRELGRTHQHESTSGHGIAEISAWIRVGSVRLTGGQRGPSWGAPGPAQGEEGNGNGHRPALELPGALELRASAQLVRGRWQPRIHGIDVSLLPAGTAAACRRAGVGAKASGASQASNDERSLWPVECESKEDEYASEHWSGKAKRRSGCAAKAERSTAEDDEEEDSATEGSGASCLFVRMPELQRLVHCVGTTLNHAKDNSVRSAAPPHSKRNAPSVPAVVNLLGSIDLSLPRIVLVTHLPATSTDPADASKHEEPKTSTAPGPSALSIALALRGLRVQLRTTSPATKDHGRWIARGEDIWSAGAQWAEVEGTVVLDSSEEDLVKGMGASKAFSLGPSQIDISSTWLPSSPSDPPPASRSASVEGPPLVIGPSPRNHNDALIIVEGLLGPVRAHAPFETLDAAMRVLRSRKAHSGPQAAAQSPRTSTPERTPVDRAEPASRLEGRLHALPRVVGALTFSGLELRLQGPVRSSTTPDPALLDAPDPSDPFFRSWTSPELLCVSVPHIRCAFGAEWEERSVRRSEVERRAADRARRHYRGAERDRARREYNRDQEYEGQSKERSRSRSRNRADRDEERSRERERPPMRRNPTAALEDELGIPPPPPLSEDYSRRRLRPLKVAPNLTKDLDKYSLEYATRFSVTADTLNFYILASDHESHEGPETSEHDYSDSDASSTGSTSSRPRKTAYGTTTLPSDPIRFDVLALGPLELTSTMRALGDEAAPEGSATLVPWIDLATGRGEHGILLETIQVDLWRPVVMSCVRDLALALSLGGPVGGPASSSSATSNSTPSAAGPAAEAPPALPLVEILPADQSVYIALASFDLRVAGTDPKADPHSCRGIALHSGPLVLQYLMQSAHEPGPAGDYAARGSLRLAEDLRVEANATANPETPGLGPRPVALAKISLYDWTIDPVVDARASRGRRRRGPIRRGDGLREDGEHAGNDWEMRGRADLAELVGRRKSIIEPWRGRTPKEREAGRGLLMMPELSLRLRIQRAAMPGVEGGSAQGEDTPLDDVAVLMDAKIATLRIELFSIYLCLMAISSLRSLRPGLGAGSPAGAHASKDTVAAPSRKTRRPRPLVRLSGEMKELNLFPTLPHDTHLFINFHRILFSHSEAKGLIVGFEKAILAGQSPTVPGKWEDVVSLRRSEFSVRPDPHNKGYHPFTLSLRSETARLRIPFRYVFSRIVDNTASLVKATKQLIYEHVKGGTRLIIEPGPEEPKRVPQIELRVGLFAVELQDDPFETKLNIIWRAGYEEQLERLERQKAFDAKVEAIRRAEADNGDYDGNTDDEVDESEAINDDVSFTTRTKPKVGAKYTVGIDEAERALLRFNSSRWAERIRNAAAEQARREEALTRRLYGVADRNIRANARLPISLVPVSKSAPLARGTFHDISFVVSKPSFGDDDGLKHFLHDVGKGLPRDTVFSLVVPLHLTWKMAEARFQLRDYPLPVLHVPRSDNPDQPSWTCETDLVIAEEVGGPESVRRVPCAIIPQHVFEGQGTPYAIVVPRSAMATKTYGSPVIRIRSAEPLRFGWGNSMQPAISDVARVFETLTKASPDPSERIGFWDKIRLQLHWRIRLVCPGPTASVIFHLKGSRDPYALTGLGAGFAKAWKGDVELRLGYDNPDHEFFQVMSDKYVLGIPNLREYIDSAATGSVSRDTLEASEGDARPPGTESVGGSAYAASTLGDPEPPSDAGDVDDEFDDASSSSLHADEDDEDDIAYWLKVCAKCINGVRWGMAIRLERTCRDEDCDKRSCRGLSTFHRQCRSFDFIPHWQVHTKTSAAIGVHGEIADSFAGFRSDFVHFSLSLTSPANLNLPDRVKRSDEHTGHAANSDETGYNSFHFTPHAMTHFQRWWKLFDGCMSLPIRQGRLFPSAQAPSPKFGRHTATIKYRFSLAPLFISHTYRQETWAEWARGETTVLGMKGKIGRFNVDLHQRAQEMVIRRPEMSESKTVKHKAFYMAEIDLDVLDLRTITAIFDEPLKSDVAPADADIDEDAAPLPAYDDDYRIRREDREWVNLNDFHDSMYTMPVDGAEPRIRIMPFMMCPRFTYYRHKDAAPTKDVDELSADGREASTPPEKPKTKFGSEFSHTCLMGRATDTVSVHIEEAEERLRELKSQLTASTSTTLSSEIELRIKAVQLVIERLRQIRNAAQPSTNPDQDAHVQANHPPHPQQQRPPPMPARGMHEDSCDTAAFPHLTNTLYEEWGQWENRYMVHSPTVQVSNAIREVLLKYYYSHRDRKGFVYHASASVLRFIRDLAKKHETKMKRDMSRRKSTRTGAGGSQSMKPTGPFHDSGQTNRLLDDLLKKGSGRWAGNEEQDTDDGRHRFSDQFDVDPIAAAEALPEAYDSTSGHLCVFTKPQVSLQSDVDDKSTLVIAAFRAQVKVFEITDTRIVDDPVNAEVLTQTFSRLDGLQVFYPRQQVARAERRFAQAFVPLETLVDLRVEPWGFDRVVSRTSAAMRYDKFNQLRLGSKREHGSIGSSSDRESHFHTSTDRLSFEAEKFSLSANPEHFAAIYNVVTDLILYSDPLRKSRNTKVEALVFTRDFSNLSAVVDTVGRLQQQIRSLIGAAHEFQVHLDELDETGRVQLFLQRAEAFRLASELSLVVEAFTRAQDSNGAKTTSKRVGLQLEASAAELTWHMLDKGGLPFAKFSVIEAAYSWVSKQDGSAANRMVIKDLRGLNSSPEHIFDEIIARADVGDAGSNQLARHNVFCAILWNSLAPVGGISIIERFELHLHPVRLQLEHAVGRRILDYVFSSNRQHKGDGDGSNEKSDRSVQGEERGSQKYRDMGKSPSTLDVPGANSPANRSTDSLISPRKSYASSTNLTTASSAGSDRALASSSASIRSTEHRLRKAVSADTLVSDAREEGLDAGEMRRRAALNHTFIFVEISSTMLCLTYRSEKEDKSSLPNIYNITYKTPQIQYRSKTWSFLDLLDHLKRDMIRSVWQQKGQLISQLLSKTHRRLPMADARSAAKQAVTASVRKRMQLVKSRTQQFGSGSASSAIPAGPVPLPEAPRPHSPPDSGEFETPQSVEAPRDSTRRCDSSRYFDSGLQAEPIDGDFPRTPHGELLPFDLGVPDLIYPEKVDNAGSRVDEDPRGTQKETLDLGTASLALGGDALVDEPEPLTREDESFLLRSRETWPSSSADEISSGQAPTATTPSMNGSQPSTGSRQSSASHLSHDTSMFTDVDSAPASRGSVSSRVSDAERGASSYPRHRPVRRTTTALNDEEKKRMLLGKALD